MTGAARNGMKCLLFAMLLLTGEVLTFWGTPRPISIAILRMGFGRELVGMFFGAMVWKSWR